MKKETAATVTSNDCSHSGKRRRPFLPAAAIFWDGPFRLNTGNQRGEQNGHLPRRTVGRIDHIIGVVDKIIGKMITFVGDNGHPEYSDAAMATSGTVLIPIASPPALP